MLSYFHPLRRKVGVVMLSLSCLLAIGWVRSLQVRDIVGIGPVSETIICGASNRHMLLLVLLPIEHLQNGPTLPFWRTAEAKPTIRDCFAVIKSEQCWLGFGYLITDSQPESGHLATAFAVPYWSIVLPLTLLSAWLLLSKPRTRQPNPALES